MAASSAGQIASLERERDSLQQQMEEERMAGKGEKDALAQQLDEALRKNEVLQQTIDQELDKRHKQSEDFLDVPAENVPLLEKAPTAASSGSFSSMLDNWLSALEDATQGPPVPTGPPAAPRRVPATAPVPPSPATSSSSTGDLVGGFFSELGRKLSFDPFSRTTPERPAASTGPTASPLNLDDEEHRYDRRAILAGCPKQQASELLPPPPNRKSL